ncbi:unnamed protein product [Dicrocoelium dendriticum]|nr:unnamed protein product [Dicrocoelium dendriticum]
MTSRDDKLATRQDTPVPVPRANTDPRSTAQSTGYTHKVNEPTRTMSETPDVELPVWISEQATMQTRSAPTCYGTERQLEPDAHTERTSHECSGLTRLNYTRPCLSMLSK